MAKSFTIRILKIFLIATVILNVLGILLDYHMRNSNIFKVNVLFNKNLPENIILGSSRSLTGINTDLFSKLTKKNWYNLSMDDTKIETHFLFYQLLIELNKKPKNLILQYDNSSISRDSSTFFDNDYQLLPFINTNNTISNYFSKKRNYFIFKYLPIVKYVYFNVELFYPSILLLFKPNYMHRFKQNGDYDYPNNMVLPSDNKIAHTKRYIEFKNRTFNDFLNLVSIEKSKLIVYTAPIFNAHSEYEDYKGFEYFDFVHLYPDYSKFSDDFHIASKEKANFTTVFYEKTYNLIAN